MADNRDIKYTIAAEDRFGRTFAALKRDMQGGLAEAERFKGAIGGVGGGISALGLGVGAAVAVAVAGIRNLTNDLDALNDAADATGDSVENLSGLEDVARRNGASIDLVTSSLLKLNKGLADTDPNTGTSRALKAIGLSASELRGLNPSEALQRIALALQGHANDGNKARIVQELFGKSVKEVAPFLNDLAQAGKLNATVTSEQAAEAEKFNKQLSALGTNANNAGRSIVSGLLPGINELFRRLNDASSASGGFFQFIADSKFGEMTKNDTEKLASARADVERYTDSLKRLQDLQDKNGGYLSPANSQFKSNVEADLASAQRRLAFQKLNQQAAALELDGAEGGLVSRMTRAPTIKEGAKTGLVGEGQRYLESLQKQADKLLELTEYEQALQDIQQGRIKDLTPALRAQILEQARANDLDKQALDLRSAEVESRSRAGRLALDNLATLERENAELDREVRAIGLTEAALADIELARLSAAIATKEQSIALQEKAGVDERQLQQLQQEIALLEKRKTLIVDKVGKTADVKADEDRKAELDKLAKDSADVMGEFGKQAARNIQTNLGSSISSVLKSDFDNIGAAWKNLLIDMAAQAGAARVGKELFGSFLSTGNASDLGGLFKAGAGLLGIPGFAGGGDHRGGARIVGENGPELEFTGPSRILNARDTQRALSGRGGGGSITYAPQIHVDSRSDRAAVQADIAAALAASNRELLALLRDRGV